MNSSHCRRSCAANGERSKDLIWPTAGVSEKTADCSNHQLEHHEFWCTECALFQTGQVGLLLIQFTLFQIDKGMVKVKTTADIDLISNRRCGKNSKLLTCLLKTLCTWYTSKTKLPLVQMFLYLTIGRHFDSYHTLVMGPYLIGDLATPM